MLWEQNMSESMATALIANVKRGTSDGKAV